MATMSRAEPKHMYSWWWASHMSPKNSKWLQENLTDMDSKVKLMIKLIEVDEDSFARRAEMYYKKRPELMKLVEEIYRAYRALAERYDHATGVITHAHKTMAEAFPNQVPILESVNGSSGTSNDSDPHTPEMSDLVQAFWTPGELKKGDVVLTPSDLSSAQRNGPFWSRDPSFAKIVEGRVRKALDFHDSKKAVKAQGLSESDRLERSEADIKALKEALAKLEDEKEAGLLQYQQSVQRLSKLESEVLRAQGDSKGFHERASKAEAEVWSLKESLAKLEGEREAGLFHYQQCLDRISTLESYVSHAQEEEKEELARLKNEKEAGLVKFVEALENIANLENKLLRAEEKASLTSQRADHAEKEVATLKEALARITEEKEVVALQYQKCLEKIASLEDEIALSHEEAARLKDEMERSNNSMKIELDSALFKMGIQNQELSEKQVEMGRLWIRIQEERVRVVEAETAFRSLQELHSQTQEVLRSGAAELQKRVQLLKDMEVHNQNLLGEVQKIRDENKSLNELNMSSAVSIKNMDDEILNLKEGKEKLKEELELQLDQRNSLQQELYCLKEELNGLDEKHRAMLELCWGQLGEELDKAENAQFEICILRSTLQDLKETNGSLLKDCEKLLETSTLSEKLISELEDENTEQKEEVSLLTDQITSLRLGMFQLLKVLEVDLEHVSEDNLDEDQMVLHCILVKLDDTRRSLSRACDENEKLVIEKSVLVTLLGQLKQEVPDLKTLIDSLQQEFRKRSDQLSSLQGDMLKLLQSNEKLLLRVREGNHKEELLATEMGSIRTKLREMQGACEDLEKEKRRILEENKSLSKAVIDLDDEKNKIELENSCLVVETVTLDTLSLIFKSSILERSEVTNHLIDNVSKLFGDNRALEDKVRIMDAMLGEYQTKNMSLKDSLEIYDDELKQVKATKCQFEHEIADAKDLLSHKDMELLLAEALNDEKGKEVHELSKRYGQQIKESESHKDMVESLRSDLKKAKDETELWETVACTTFVELQTSSVREALYREKLFELTRDYQCLVDRNNSDGLKALQLKERVESLEGENSQIKAQWIGYVPAMATLSDAIASLERHVMYAEVDNVHDEDISSSYRLSEGELPGDEHHHIVTKQPDQTSDPQEAECKLALKDIMLDKASESSSHRNNSINIWYNNAESNDQIVELWEAVKAGNFNENELHSSEIPAEKELRVDSLELSKRYTELDEAESNKKILERLTSDAQKLTNLQVTVHDLKEKVAMITEKAEYSDVNEQIEKAERAITNLADVNSKLVNHTQDCSTDTPLWPTSSPISDPSEIEENERRRRKVSEQARRCSEKIGRMQVEVQKIQFLLLKLDSGNIIGRSNEHDRKVPLRDYLYGPRRRMKASFCACLKPPPTSED